MDESFCIWAIRFSSCLYPICHSGLRAGIQREDVFEYWMPDQARNDNQSKFGILVIVIYLLFGAWDLYFYNLQFENYI